MPAIGMRPIVLAALLLGSAVWQASAAGGWFPGMFANPLKGVQRRLQQQQHQRLAHLEAAFVDSGTAELVGRRLQQLEKHQQSLEQQGSYGYGSYAAYGYYGYQGAAGVQSSNSNGRSLLSVPSLAPTLLYKAPEHVEHRVLAGLHHQDEIEVSAVAAAAIINSAFDTVIEQRAARKLLVASTDIVAPVAAVPAQVVTLQPDALLSSASRSLLQDASTSAGGYGYGGYGYGSYASYGYGGYGGGSASSAPASSPGAGRALLEAVEGDDVQLYNLWLQQYNSKHHGV